jgi:hypothetical protein
LNQTSISFQRKDIGIDIGIDIDIGIGIGIESTREE